MNYRIALTCLAVSSALPTAAWCADTLDAGLTTPSLGEITVQARRRDERQIDVPVAVTVESGAQLRDQDAVLFDDIAREVPNLRMTPSPQSVSAMDVTLRGQSAIRAAIDYDPAVGIYVDGVYVANGQAAMNTLLDIDSVQVVRGAQGTLFGRNNTGGAILFNSRRPEPERLQAEVAADTGTFGLFSGRAMVNLPLGDRLAVRLAWQDNERQGYGSSVGSGQGGFDNQHRYQARLGVLWQGTQGIDAYATYEHFEAREQGALLHPLGGTVVDQLGQLYNQVPQLQQAFPGAGLVPVSPYLLPASMYQTGAGQWSHDNTTLDATQLTLNARLTSEVGVKLIAAYRHLGNDTAIDVDASSLPMADTTLTNASAQKSLELQFQGSMAHASVDWLAGLYAFQDDGNAPSTLPAVPGAYLQDYLALQGIGLLPAGNPPFAAVPVSAQSFLTTPTIERNTVGNRSMAAFAHADWHLSEQWSAAAGLRHTRDTRRISENSYLALPGGLQACTILDQSTGAPANGGGSCPPIDRQAGFGYWSWEFSSSYRVDDATHVYLRNGRAQRSGGWNLPVNTLQDQPFRPERLTDYELGLKADLFGGGVLVNTDVFLGNYDDMQRLLPQLVGGTPTTYVINAGRARVSGAEFEGDVALSRDWSARLSLGWTQARYKQFAYLPGGGQPAIDASSNAFSQTPRFNAALGAGYSVPVYTHRLSLHLDYAWQDAVAFNVFNDANHQGAYGTLNARAALAQDARARWELAAFGTNLTQKTYAVTGGSVATGYPPQAPAFSWQIPGAPRMLGLELTWRWGSPDHS